MAINFPTSLDTLTNPSSTDKVDTVDHASQHSDINDIAEAIEAKVGADSSAVTTSHDYKLGGVTGSDKAASLAGTETLTNKQLTSPKIGTAITDTNGNEIIETPATGSAVNHLKITNAASGNDVLLDGAGETNVGITIKGKGSGTVKIGDADLVYPDSDGSSGDVLQTDGAGTLSLVTPTSVPTITNYITIPFKATNNAAATLTTKQLNSRTTMHAAIITLPEKMTVNKISFKVTAHAANGVAKIAVYSEDGQTKHIEMSTASITGTGVVTTTLGAPVDLDGGNYYFCILGTVAAVDFTVNTWNTLDNAGLSDSIASENQYEGTYTVTTDTIPSTIDPTSMTAPGEGSTLVARLD